MGRAAALLGLLFALVPVVVHGGSEPIGEFDPTGRAVLVSLDTPAADASATATPTPGSSWALVTVPRSDENPDGMLGAPLARAIADYVRSLLERRAAVPDTAPVDVPVQGVAGTAPDAARRRRGSGPLHGHGVTD